MKAIYTIFSDLSIKAEISENLINSKKFIGISINEEEKAQLFCENITLRECEDLLNKAIYTINAFRAQELKDEE